MMDMSDHIGMETSMETKDDVVAAVKKKKNKYKESPSSSLELPRTLELRRHGYVALARGLGSGTYDLSPTGQLESQASTGAFEFMSRQNRDQFAAALIRQSSMETEPKTLTLIAVRQAKVPLDPKTQENRLIHHLLEFSLPTGWSPKIINAYDGEEVVYLFLKDAEDEHLREEALAAILPIYI